MRERHGSKSSTRLQGPSHIRFHIGLLFSKTEGTSAWREDVVFYIEATHTITQTSQLFERIVTRLVVNVWLCGVPAGAKPLTWHSALGVRRSATRLKSKAVDAASCFCHWTAQVRRKRQSGFAALTRLAGLLRCLRPFGMLALMGLMLKLTRQI